MRNVISRMIGTACQATRSSWLTAEVNRKSLGRMMTRAAAVPSAPNISAKRMRSRQEPVSPRPRAASAETILFSRAGGRTASRLTPCISSRSLRSCAGSPTISALPPDTLKSRVRRPQKPGAERIEAAHVTHVDRHASCFRRLPRDAVNQRLQRPAFAAVQDPAAESFSCSPSNSAVSKGVLPIPGSSGHSPSGPSHRGLGPWKAILGIGLASTGATTSGISFGSA